MVMIKSGYDVRQWEKIHFWWFNKKAYQSSLTVMHHTREAESISHWF